MTTLRVLTHEGDRTIAWDTAALAAGDSETQAAVCEAERLFGEMRARGGAAFALGPGQITTRLDHFDFSLEQILLVPRIIGG
jgi:hypothetical protein